VLRRAFSLVPEYLRTEEDSQVTNFMDYGVPLGRRFRALKLWFVMRAYGREWIAARLRDHVEWTRELARSVGAHPCFELSAPAPLSVVCFRYRGTDEQNRQLLERINAGGEIFLSHTVLNGRFVLRFAIGNLRSTRDQIRRAWEEIQRLAQGVAETKLEET